MAILVLNKIDVHKNIKTLLQQIQSNFKIFTYIAINNLG